MSFSCSISDISSDKVNVAMRNIVRCADAIALDVTINRILHVTINRILQESCMKSNASLIQIEDDLLAIAATDFSDAVFHCCLFKMKIYEGNEQYYGRYFESGAFEGFFNNVCRQNLKAEFNVEDIFAVNTFTKADVTAFLKHKSELYKGRKTGYFYLNIHTCNLRLRLFLLLRCHLLLCFSEATCI